MKKDIIDFPADKLNLVYPEIEQLISTFFKSWVDDETERYKSLLDKYTEYFKAYEKKIDTAANADQLGQYFYENTKHRDQIFKLLESLFTEETKDDPEEGISALIAACQKVLEPLPEYYYSRQQEPRFMASKQDNLRVRALKKSKKALRGLERGIIGVYNFPRKLFGMKPVEVHWNQKVALKNIVYAQTVINSIHLQNRAISEFYQGASAIYMSFWKADSMINQRIQKFLVTDYDLNTFKTQLTKLEILSEIENSQKQLEAIVKAYAESATLNFSACREAVAADCDLSGTLERKKSLDRSDTIERNTKKVKKEVITSKRSWNNTYFVLSEDWKLDLEIFSITCLTYKEFFDFSETINARLTQDLKLKIKDFTTIVDESQAVFEKIKSEASSDLYKDIEKLRLAMKKELLLNLVPTINTLILQAKIPEYIDSFEKLMRQQVDKLSTKRLLLKSSEYDKPINLSEAESISPYSLVTFEMMPRFFQVFPTLKSNIINFIAVLQNEIEEIPEILDFSLDSTIQYFKSKQDKEGALKISSEGFLRASKKAGEINNRLIETINASGDKLKTAIDKFTSDLIEVTDNENALQIKFRITKAKAIEKAKAIRLDITNRIKNFIPVLISQTKIAANLLKLSSQKIKRHLAESDEDKFVATEISDYLTETEAAIAKLPFVYQRLFKIEPLEAFELFVERTDPVEKLRFAYDKWKEGKFAPVVIIGEKGCGKTSLINKYINFYVPADQATYFDLHKKPRNPEKLYKEIEKASRIESGKDENSLIPEKKVVVVDGLEKLFLTNVDGFTYIKKIFQLISDTNTSIFWMFTCHEYSWNYLDRCVSASDYFGYHIKLRDITDEHLKNMILKRNSISGYNLVYNPGTQEKTFSFIPKRKHTPEQKDLEKLYFSQLNSITGGNITIALLYWMRSTENVTEDTIYIRSLSNLNLQFVRSISKSKMVTIRSLIIHNGLSIESYAMIFRISEEKSSYTLNQLLNDGILQLSQGIYSVNPLIYSQIIGYLRQLNLLS